MVDFLLAALPIVFLVVVMTMPRPLPSALAFLFAALLAYLLRGIYFGDPMALLNASVLAGLLSALTPISIVFGAILFFITLEKTKALDVIKGWLRGISPNPVAQLMIVGWSFMFLIEGACGFGTPAALAAPILMGLGFPAIRVAMLCIVFNTIPVVFGAVGTPLWFGFEPLDLPEETMLELGVNAAILTGIAALVIPVLALRFVIEWKNIRRNILFIYLSILASILPMVAVSLINYEFPSVFGGVCALVSTILLARFGVGLERSDDAEASRKTPLPAAKIMVALTPLFATVLILLVTRIPALGLRQWLSSDVGGISLDLGRLGAFGLSPSLVVSLENILGQGLNWSHALLYVPSIIPFVLAATLALILYRSSASTAAACLRETASRIRKPVYALLGALVFVNLINAGGEGASTMILGKALADAAGGAWMYFSPFLGALGSFFSGSATISNLTFGSIQASIAADTGLEPARLLALQAAGAAMGNMVCIHNIVAVCAVLSLSNVEGKILKAVFPLLLLYGAILAAVAHFLL